MHHYYAMARIAQDRIDDMGSAAAQRNERERLGQTRPGPRSRRRRRWSR